MFTKHNTPIDNAEFRVQFTETNLQYLLTAPEPDPEKIRICKERLWQAKHDLAVLKPIPPKFDTFSFIMAYEGGELTEEEMIEGFQVLIDTGLAWSLQGCYGRTAVALIEAGHCTRK